MKIQDLKIRLFADGADKQGMLDMLAKPYIKGFTTNPTLMRKAGVQDYEAFAKDILSSIKDHPISFEVFSDDFSEMEIQAEKIKSWGANVYVKIPITNTKGEPSYKLISNLTKKGVKLNVTAVFTLDQVRETVKALIGGAPAVISVFAGRIADTGTDPMPLMREAKTIIGGQPGIELLWASPRELLNIIQANECGTDIITATNDILEKLKFLEKDLSEFSKETVQMFYNDASKAGYKL